MTRRRTAVFVVAGAGMMLAGLVVGFGGIAPLTEHRDADGYYMSDPFVVAGSSPVVIVRDVEFLLGRYETMGEESLVEGCTLTGGHGMGGRGGGVYCSGSSPTLTNCTISGNSGRGVYCSGWSPTLTNCTIWGNSGSGVYCREGS